MNSAGRKYDRDSLHREILQPPEHLANPSSPHNVSKEAFAEAFLPHISRHQLPQLLDAGPLNKAAMLIEALKLILYDPGFPIRFSNQKSSVA